MPTLSLDRARDRRRERSLVQRMSAGDEAAFDAFCDDYLPILYRYVLRRLAGDADLAEEIVQATLAKVIGKIGQFEGRSALSTWLCACSNNEIAAHFRKLGRAGREVELVAEEVESDRSIHPVDGDGPERGLLRREGAELVHRVLDALPPHYGRALEWKYLERLPVREIARRLELGPKAAESLLTRARGAFRDAYQRLLDASRGAAGRSRPADRRMAV